MKEQKEYPDLKEVVRSPQVLCEYLKKMIIDSLRLEAVTEADIDPDAPLFREGLGLDSIDALELVVAIEKTFGIVIEDEETGKRALASVHALVAFIRENYPASS